jgi:predicted nucleotidyltransferase
MDETLIEKVRQYLAGLPTVGIHASRAVLFGSYARGEADPDSDMDVLVDFEEGAEPGLLEIVGLQNELSQILGRPVDLVERKAVEQSENYIRRRHILDTAETVYVAGYAYARVLPDPPGQEGAVVEVNAQ